MFFFRINKIKITDNMTGRGFLGLGEDKATVQLWSLITNDNMDLPDVSPLISTSSDAKAKEDVVKDILSRVVASRRLTPISNVRDNYTATFGDTGYVLYQHDGIPENFNWQMIAIKLNDKTRDIGNTMLQVVNHQDFKTFSTDSLPKFLGTLGVANPTTLAVIAAAEVGKFVVDIVGSILKNKKDKQLGLLYMSLNKQEHYLHGKRDSQDVRDLTGNMSVDYSIFAFDKSHQ